MLIMNLKIKILLSAMIILLIMIPLDVYSANTNNTTQNNTNFSILSNNNLSQNNTTLLNVPNLVQPTTNASGPAALQAVLSYYGMDINVDQLVNSTNTTQNGTLPSNIAKTAGQLGFTSQIKENMTLAGLQKLIDQGTPVIVYIQAVQNNSTSNINWTNDQNNGQYMVVIGIDNNNVYLEDPAIIGSRGFIPNQQFLERWHDTYQIPNTVNNTNGTNMTNVTNNQLGIIITGKTAPARQFIIEI